MTVSGYQKRKETEGQIKRIAVYSLLLFILRVAECSFFGGIRYLPAVPDLVLGALTVIALIDTRETAIISAIIGGVLTDAIGASGVYLSPLFYFCVVLLLCLMSKKMMRSYLSFLVLMPVSLLARAVFTLGRGWLFGNRLGALEILRYAVLPEAICTAVFCLALYPIICICADPLLRGRKS